ncbi:MAG: nitrous oxide reductase accessory protein NosL [Ignavibacteria bacterium]|nr:nitrous oxide reductase accessory protein NosL [Ignavibacteria bacterium]MCC7159535.1 nitrous oxide reductase accessory protein NosL [Ignavibacteria bacterium]
MKQLKLKILLAVMLTAGFSCSTEPEDINFSGDQCSLCKMNISDTKFGAEIVTKKGKIYKYDAVECMMNALSLGNVAYDDAAGFYTIDASHPKHLTDAVNAAYLISEKLPSPMGANLTAFGKKSDAESKQKEFGGEVQSWNDLLLKFKVK